MTPPTTATKKRPPRAKKPDGQWLVDGTDPLNDDERIKQEDPGLSCKQRIIELYSQQGFDSISAEDLAPRFKWVGLYTQRKQNLGGEFTSSMTNAELQDKYFMLRVRFDGGVVSTEQLRVVGEISAEYARGTADFTDRQNIQLHWIRIEDMPAIWDKLDNAGLSTLLGCGDVPRVILGSPVAGIAADEIIDGTPAIQDLVDNWLEREEFHNLPRKFKSAISGSPRQDVTHEIQDLAFIGVNHPEHGPGFDVYVGGGLSTNPMLAQRLGVWVSLEQVPEVWVNTVRVFRDYGYRRLRNRARLKFLVAAWGVEKFRQILEEDYLGYKLADGPAAPVNPGNRDHIGVHKQKDGRFYVGVKPTVGHATGEQLIAIADAAERHNVSRLRTTVDKELLFLDVEESQVEPLSGALEEVGLYTKPSEFRRGVISCTGLEFCKLALVTTKARAIELVDDLEQRLGDLDVPLRISLNGCPNSCARTQVADIGLKGQLVTDDEGNKVEGFQVHLGGALGFDPDFGRKLRGHKVTSKELGDYVVRVVGKYKEQRAEGEHFREWVLRAAEEDLQ
ncbi:nitrite/sulfite reductase [Corynebacterium canis]|uniref:assimilatory sulfite reductase (ferredoxin) n=1 Tax=Corynebacterium canis TaxID=679663 RepID=A0A5C5UQX7_9CORY|nr:nitrite/sulfite reductase [Corynebacterium canis]TWT28891.1 nitrite/sulfite reductase [Corynebacterium canis]WJY75030.1 Sulfite reductase [ferredoxin] [Corynebacterium canis]